MSRIFVCTMLLLALGGVAVLGERDRWHVLRREVYRDVTLDDFVAIVEATGS